MMLVYLSDACLLIRCVFIYQMLVFSNATYLRFCMMIFAKQIISVNQQDFSLFQQLSNKFTDGFVGFLVKIWQKVSQSNTLELHMPPCCCHY